MKADNCWYALQEYTAHGIVFVLASMKKQMEFDRF
ncbi:hypothetical protein BV455_03054 [Parageobacillus caldoxylosilyticus]|jgi:hypothetical protein|nr:hypothetical protein [Parageobacillus caldoxylosilyticus]QXJ39688.1 hypothetical protein BV455_03054 [Parageobacillus caldoxylosilyticus]